MRSSTSAAETVEGWFTVMLTGFILLLLTYVRDDKGNWEARRAAFSQSIARLQQASTAAVSTLLDVMVDPASPPSVRVRAADGGFDFVISEEDGTVILDVFDAENDNSDEAHIESLEFESVDEAKEAAQSCAA